MKDRATISIDAEKAMDRIKAVFIQKTLKTLGEIELP